MPLLPPPTDPAIPLDPAVATALITYSDNLIRQAQQSPATERQFDQAEENYNLYLGNHGGDRGTIDAYRYVYNRIKTIVVSHAAIQSGQKKLTFLPRQSGAKGSCFINATIFQSVAPLLAQLGVQIPPECVVPPPARAQPLPREIYDQLDALIQQGQMAAQQAMAMKMPPPKVLPPELIVEVSDTTAADALQMLFDAKWDDCGADLTTLLDAMQNGIIGWQHIFYRWDRQAEQHDLHLAEFRQVFLDPTRPDISKSATAVFGLILSEEEAMAKFPEFKLQIDNGFTMGKPSYAGIQYQRAAIYEDTNFLQKYGEIRFTWIRNQPYPMAPEEALARKLVVMGYPAPIAPIQKGAADGAASEPASNPGADASENNQLPEDGLPDGGTKPADNAGEHDDMEAQSSADGQPESEVEGGTVDAAESAGKVDDMAGLGGVDAQPAPTAYILIVNGQPAHEVKPWGPDWPTRRGIREFIMIAGDCVADRELREADIPLTHNVNYPLFYGPLGQGTPADLRDLNLAINSIISDLVTLMREQAFRVNIVSNSLESANPNISKNQFRRPGTTLTAPDDLMMDLKLHMQSIDPGNASTDIWKFLSQLLDLIDKQGDMASILQGQTNAGMSGKLFADASSAAQNAILFRARRQELMLIQLAKLMLGGLYRMSADGLAEAMPGTPIYVWEAFQDWWQRGQFQLDFHSEVGAGGGAARQQRVQQRIAAAQTGVVPISAQTLLEGLDLDADKESRQNQEWAAENQPMQPVTGEQGPAQAPPTK